MSQYRQTTISSGARANIRGSAATAPEHLRDGTQHDLHVEPERPVLDVVVVEAGPVGDGRVPTQPADLRQPGEPDGYPVAHRVVRVVGGELVHEERALRTRPDERHVAAQDVP